MFEVQVGERFVRAFKIVEAAFQHGTRSDIVAGRLVMKGHRQLDQTLEVASQMAMPRCLPPHVFEDLMGVEKAGGVEQLQAAAKSVFHRNQSNTGGAAKEPYTTCFHIPY
jgi:hypothetical protein